MRILLVSAFLVLADQVTKIIVRKHMVLYESIPVIDNFFYLTFLTNDGMAFGINFPFGIYIFTSISIILTILLLYYLWTIKSEGIVIRTGISMILSGAIGNLIDRIYLGDVVDFLDFAIGSYHWYVFNLADSYVTIGMALVLFDSIILDKKRLNRLA